MDSWLRERVREGGMKNKGRIQWCDIRGYAYQILYKQSSTKTYIPGVLTLPRRAHALLFYGRDLAFFSDPLE